MEYISRSIAFQAYYDILSDFETVLRFGRFCGEQLKIFPVIFPQVQYGCYQTFTKTAVTVGFFAGNIHITKNDIRKSMPIFIFLVKHAHKYSLLLIFQKFICTKFMNSRSPLRIMYQMFLTLHFLHFPHLSCIGIVSLELAFCCMFFP